jgi:hypothetical protein
MVLEKTAETKRAVQYYGINRVTVADGENGVFEAFLELAFNHTQKDIEIYEAVARQIDSPRAEYSFYSARMPER